MLVHHYIPFHLWRYSPFWTLASLRRQSILLCLLLLTSVLAFLDSVICHSGRRPSILVLVFPLVLCLCWYNAANQASDMDSRDYEVWGIMLYYRPPDWPVSTSPKHLSLATSSTNRKAGQVGGNGEEHWRVDWRLLIRGTFFPQLHHCTSLCRLLLEKMMVSLLSYRVLFIEFKAPLRYSQDPAT